MEERVKGTGPHEQAGACHDYGCLETAQSKESAKASVILYQFILLYLQYFFVWRACRFVRAATERRNGSNSGGRKSGIVEGRV
jgi:hypothetical protein